MQTDPEELWVERTENSLAIEAITNREPFDVYIDEVRFIPDAATVVKVRRKTVFFFSLLINRPFHFFQLFIKSNTEANIHHPSTPLQRWA